MSIVLQVAFTTSVIIFHFGGLLMLICVALVYLFEPLYCIQLHLYNNQFIKLLADFNFLFIAANVTMTIFKQLYLGITCIPNSLLTLSVQI